MAHHLFRPSFAVLAVLLSLAASTLSAETLAPSLDPHAHETPAERDQRMAWFREAKFGMFIHWGVYAVPAGTYHGEQVKGIGEWIMLRAQIPWRSTSSTPRSSTPRSTTPTPGCVWPRRRA